MYKDTLTLYEELIAAGTSEAAAKIQAHQLGEVGNALSGLTTALNEFKVSIEKDMFWMRIIGAAMIITFFSNGFFIWLAK